MRNIESTFKHNAQGWTMEGDVASSGFESTGGDPKGYFGWVDAATGSDSYYVAPQAYDGDKHAFYGGTLSYDVKDTGNDYSGVPDVTLTGANGVTLVAAIGQPGTDWTHMSIEVAAGAGWHVGTLDGADATKADFRGVLANVTGLDIRAEYVSGDETGGLDNVFLTKTSKAGPTAAHETAFHADLPQFAGQLDHHHLAIA